MITNNNYDQLCNLLENLYLQERLFPRLNSRSRRGAQLGQILDYSTAYGEDRQARATKMKRGEIPRTVAQGDNPENPRQWINKYVNKASLRRVINERNGIVIVRSQKFNVRSIQDALFKGIRLNRPGFNGIYKYYVKVENDRGIKCSCPDRLERNVECKHMKLVTATIVKERQASAITRRLERLGIDPRNVRRATRRRPRNASSRISTRTRLFQQ
jgi:hypothetical protein